LVARQGMELAAIGIAMGLAGAHLTRLMARLSRRGNTLDTAARGAVVALLAAVALAATAIPAWRTTLVDPIVALQEE
jgi:putative ABC transport system permease protein